jgi:hypothetical protein
MPSTPPRRVRCDADLAHLSYGRMGDAGYRPIHDGGNRTWRVVVYGVAS